ncbi:MAG: protease modulator HflK [Proteobacteria bacterium]|nr:protease modulator HflK [Pseudomonadota bacterium]
MRGNDEFESGRVLAMAGGKSPWGKGSGTAEADPPVVDPDAGTAEDAPAAGGSDSAPRPFNPWLPPQREPESGRRSANIEDILRQRAFRPGGTGGGARTWLPLVLIGAVVAWIGGTSIHFLGKGEQGLVTTFGKYQKTVGSGLTLTLPWPVQAIASRNTAKIEELALPDPDGENLMITSDRQLADIAVKFRWRITDLKRFTYGADNSEKAIAQLADAQVHAAVAEQTFDDLIEGSRRVELQQVIAARSQAVLDAWKLGVKVDGVEIVRANPPARLSDAFRKIADAKQETRKKIEDAQNSAQRTLSNAQTEAADFEAVYAQYKEAPGITRKRRYYEAMERVLANNAKIVVGSGTAGVTVAAPPAPSPGETPSPAATGGQ